MSFGSMDLIAGKLKEIAKPPATAAIVNDDDFKISYAFQNLDEIDKKMYPKNPEKILVLDLTENNFNGSNDLRFLFDFPNLKTLILVNHNNIENLSVFIQNLSSSCPNLTYLSMINNKAAPSYFNGGTLVEYNDYRLYVISKLDKMQMLDHKVVSPEERMKSCSIYGKNKEKLQKQRKSSSLKIKKNSLQYKPQSSTENNENGEQTLNLDKSIEDKKESGNVNENKAKTRKNKTSVKSLSQIEIENNEKSLDFLDDLQKVKEPNKDDESYLKQLNLILKANENEEQKVDHELLPEISDESLQFDGNNLSLNEREFIQNELKMLSITDSEETELPECIQPPSPSFSLIVDLESLPNPKDIIQDDLEQNNLSESLSNLLPEDLPSFRS